MYSWFSNTRYTSVNCWNRSFAYFVFPVRTRDRLSRWLGPLFSLSLKDNINSNYTPLRKYRHKKSTPNSPETSRGVKSAHDSPCSSSCSLHQYVPSENRVDRLRIFCECDTTEAAKYPICHCTEFTSKRKMATAAIVQWSSSRHSRAPMTVDFGT